MSAYPPHFSRDEMIHSDYATRNDIDNTPTPQAEKNLIELAWWLEELREHLGEPIIINSGYRSVYLNRAIGGSQNSAHTKGLAADIRVRSRTAYELAVLIADVMRGQGYDQIICEYGRWVHVGLSAGGLPRYQKLTARRDHGATIYIEGLHA